MPPTPTPSHAADRLLDAIDRFGSPACVGIDPVDERVPDAIRGDSPIESIRTFTLGVLDAVAKSKAIPCVKFQSACYERYRVEGVRVLHEMIAEAKRRDLEVILDAKRGDIGVTAEHYAAAAFGEVSDLKSRDSAKDAFSDTCHLEPDTCSDWLTINSYLGPDAIEPFLIEGRGCFALVRTSNPGSDALQTKRLETGETVAEAVARMVAHIGEKQVGARGYSALGAVVGATKASDAGRLRDLMPRQMFLVPGYGAQGGTADDVVPCFRKDDSRKPTGAIITASRSVIYAYKPNDANWTQRIIEAAKRFADEIAEAVYR